MNTVLSLLTAEEESEFKLDREGVENRAQGLKFLSFPISDRHVPESEAKLGEVVDRITNALSSGENIVVHCRQGIGRSGLVAACLLIRKGLSPGAATEKVSAARGVPVPETAEQRAWIDHYATMFAK